MRGRIVSYNPTTGVGKIIIKNQGIKLFNIDNWIDYNKVPQMGLEVEFTIEGNELKDILSSDSSFVLLDKLSENFKYILPTNLNIQEDVSLDYCLEEFFNKYKKIALKYKDLLNIPKTLPYKKVKRFIFTAYNNLIELDFGINDKELVDVRHSLEEIEKFYDLLKNETKNPIFVILEKLVLNKQQNYQVLKKRFEKNKSFITEATKNANLLEIKIEKLKEHLQKREDKKGKEFQEEEKLLKAYKKKYVDLIDLTQNLKDENSTIVDDIKQFENAYKEIFEKIFKNETTIILKILQKEMDVLAYQFDTMMWENAKQSNVIKHFFKEAKIEGSYSTKTFMKYYLKNLNSDKMNHKDSELVEIFNELKVFNKHILIFDKHRNRAREILSLIEDLDHDSDVKIFDDIKQFVFYVKDNDSSIDVIIVLVDNKIYKTIQKIIPFLEKLPIKVLIFSNEFSDENVIEFSMERLKKEMM